MQVYFSWNRSDLHFSLGLGLSLVCETGGEWFVPLLYCVDTCSFGYRRDYMYFLLWYRTVHKHITISQNMNKKSSLLNVYLFNFIFGSINIRHNWHISLLGKTTQQPSVIRNSNWGNIDCRPSLGEIYCGLFEVVFCMTTRGCCLSM